MGWLTLEFIQLTIILHAGIYNVRIEKENGKVDVSYHHLEDDESSDDSILIVDPGWDDYCLQELKLNRPVPLCPEARRARI
ncbi:hypothetical protein Tco_0837412 [Tanacetum coccineum]